MSEGAPQFETERNWTLRTGIGAVVWPIQHLGLHGGFQVRIRHERRQNGTGEQGELSLGVVYRW
jgi:hypothetical protein